MVIIENTKIAQDQYGRLYGSEWKQITEEQLSSLLKGKQLAITVNDEYVTFMSLAEPK